MSTSGPSKAGPSKAEVNPATATTASTAPLRVADLMGDDDDLQGPDAPRGANGLGPQDQIRQRDEQSRRDASVQADARRLAATRALGSLSAMGTTGGPDRAEATTTDDRAAVRPPPPPAATSPSPSPTSPSTTSTSTTAPMPPSPSVPGPTSPPAWATTAPSAPRPVSVPPPPAHLAPGASGSGAAPLLEVKPSQMFTDTQHLGERLAIFNDRIELRDRADRVRQMIPAAEITNVVVHKRFTGSTVTVECRDAEPIIAKGLKPDQADEIRALILKRTREGANASAAATSPPANDARTGTTATAEPAAIDQVDLAAKLAALRSAGVLTETEYRDKLAVLARLASGASLAASASST